MDKIDKKNLYWNSSAFIITSLLGFLNFTLNLKTYDFSTFGFFLLLNSYWGIGASLDLGFGVSTIKNIAEAAKKNDDSQIKVILNTFLITYIIIGLIISIVILFIFFLWQKNIDISIKYKEFDVSMLMLLLATSFLFRYVSGFIVTVYEGLAKFVVVSKLNLVVALLNTVLVLVIFLFKLSLFYLAIANCIVSISLLVILLVYLPSQRSCIQFDLRYFDMKVLKMHGLYNLNIQLSFLLTSFIDPIMKSILSFSLGLQFVTYFETGKKIINLSNGLIHSALKGLLNKISEANATGEMKEFVNHNICYYSNISVDYSVFVYGILNPLICIFILYWFNNYESLIIFLIFLLPYSIINYGGPLYSVLMIEGKGGRLVIMQSINVLLVSVLLYFTIYFSSSYLGIIGFYFATIINMFLVFLFLKKYIGFDVKRFFVYSKTRDLLKLNLALFFELVLCLIFPKFLNYIFVFLLIVYSLLFTQQLKHYSKVFLKKFKKFINNKPFSKIGIF